MNTYLRPIILASAAAAFVSVVAPADAQVVPPNRRAEALEQSRVVLDRNPIPAVEDLEALHNPFVPSGTAVASTTGPATPDDPTPLSDREILENIATGLRPSGSAVLGGTPILLFRERRLRVGDYLNVAYDGRDYVIQITDISSSTFTVKLNQETHTRPIQ